MSSACRTVTGSGCSLAPTKHNIAPKKPERIKNSKLLLTNEDKRHPPNNYCLCHSYCTGGEEDGNRKIIRGQRALGWTRDQYRFKM